MANLNNSASILAQIISGAIAPEVEEYCFNSYEGDQQYQVEYDEEEYQEEYDSNAPITYSLNLSIKVEDEEYAMELIREYPYICGEAIFTWRRDISELEVDYLQWVASIAWQSGYQPLSELVDKLLVLINKY
jgi:hypothetical protein